MKFNFGDLYGKSYEGATMGGSSFMYFLNYNDIRDFTDEGESLFMNIVVDSETDEISYKFVTSEKPKNSKDHFFWGNDYEFNSVEKYFIEDKIAELNILEQAKELQFEYNNNINELFALHDEQTKIIEKIDNLKKEYNIVDPPLKEIMSDEFLNSFRSFMKGEIDSNEIKISKRKKDIPDKKELDPEYLAKYEKLSLELNSVIKKITLLNISKK